MTQESWNLKLLTMVMKCRLEDGRDHKKWGELFKAHWKQQPKEGEWKMGYGTYLKTISHIDKKILDHIPDELSDVLEDIEDDSVPF